MWCLMKAYKELVSEVSPLLVISLLKYVYKCSYVWGLCIELQHRTGTKHTCTLRIRYNTMISLLRYVYKCRGSRRLQNPVAISQRYCQPLLPSKARCIGNNGKIWLLNPETSSQSEGYISKWLIWLVCGEPLVSILHEKLIVLMPVIIIIL